MLLKVGVGLSTFNNPGMRREGRLCLLHEATRQQLERPLLQSVCPEDAMANGTYVNGTANSFLGPKQYLQQADRASTSRTTWSNQSVYTQRCAYLAHACMAHCSC